MDDSKERRRSVKSRRRSLRNLQLAEIQAVVSDVVATVVEQPKYGSVWIEPAESPVPIRKPRRVFDVSYDSPNFTVRNKENNKYLEKENLFPNSTNPTFLNRVDDTTEQIPTNISDCSLKDDRNPEKRLEGRHFGYIIKNGSLVFINEMDAQYQDEKVIRDENEWQVSDSFSRNEQNNINFHRKDLSPENLTTHSRIKPVNCFIEEKIPTFTDWFSDSVNSCSTSTNVSNIPSPTEIPNYHREKIFPVAWKDSLEFSTDLCQNLQRLDISENVCPENNFQTNSLDEKTDAKTFNQSSFRALLSPRETIDSSPSDLNQGFLQKLDSDISSLNDSTLSEGCDLWETDLSSAGSELSDSWCFSRHLNTANELDSSPCKTGNLMVPKTNLGQCAYSGEPLIYTTDDEIKKEHETVCIQREEEQKLPAIEYLSLDDDDSCFPRNEKCQTNMLEKFLIEGSERCSSSNDESTKDGFVKGPTKKTLHKNLTPKISDSKMPELNLSTKRKKSGNCKKSSFNQSSTLTLCSNKNVQDVTRFVSIRTKKKSTTVNGKKADKSSDKLLKSPIDIKNDLEDEKISLTLDKHPPNKLILALEKDSRNTIQAESEPKTQKIISPEVLIVDSLKTSSQINKKQAPKVKAKTSDSIKKSNKLQFTEQQNLLKKSTMSMPGPNCNLNSLVSQGGCQQENNQAVNVCNDEVKLKDQQKEGKNTSTFNKVSSVLTSAAKTRKHSLDSLDTSTVTIRRLNTRTKPKLTNNTCKEEASKLNFVSMRDKAKKLTSNKKENIGHQLLSVPVLEFDDVAVVDLESLGFTTGTDSSISDNIFNKKEATKRTKRLCQSIGSANFSIETSFLNADETVSPTKDCKVSPSASDELDKQSSEPKNESGGGSLEMVIGNAEPEYQDSTCNKMNSEINSKVTRGRRRALSMGSISELNSLKSENISDECDDAVHSPKQTPFHRSSRKKFMELSLSLNNEAVSAAEEQSNKNNPILTQSVKEKSDCLKSPEDEHLIKIYAKKPYVPFHPSQLETIYSPAGKRGKYNVFSKRKFTRKLLFQPSEAQIRKRRKKALRNGQFLFEVLDADEKLNKLLDII